MKIIATLFLSLLLSATQAQSVTFENTKDKVTLAGSLNLPGPAGRFPAVILISGSGADTRNGTAINGKKPFIVLADYLVKRGFAVLRYDDRGAGRSTGKRAGATIYDFANDAEAAYNFLRRHPAIDPSRIGIIGHSEGGITGLIFASRTPALAFYIALGTPRLNGMDSWKQQSASLSHSIGIPDSVIQKSWVWNMKVWDRMQRSSAAAFEKELPALADDNYNGFSPEAKQMISRERYKKFIAHQWTPNFRALVNFTPEKYYPAAKCPVLVLIGSKDLRVPPVPHLKAWQQDLKKAGHRDVTVREMPGINHMLQQCVSCKEAEYGTLPETISPALMDVLGKWMQQKAGVKI